MLLLQCPKGERNGKVETVVLMPIDADDVAARALGAPARRSTLPRYVYPKGKAGYLYFVCGGVCLRMPDGPDSPEFIAAYDEFRTAHGPKATSKSGSKARPPRLLPSRKELARLFAYDAATGALHWHNDGSRADRSDGKAIYREVRFFGQSWLAHRVVWKMLTGQEPDVVDHISGDKQDNRFGNLRSVSSALNSRNRALPEPTHGVHGVYPQGSRWKATAGGRHLGLFSNKEDAVEARRVALDALDYHPNHGRPIR